MYSYIDRIRYSRANADGYINLFSIANYFQDASIAQSDDLGVGIDYLSDRGMGWILATYVLKVHRYPRRGENIVVSTNPYQIKGYFGFRYFQIATDNGEVCIEADSVWMLMDLVNMRPIRVPEDVNRYVAEPKPDVDFGPSKVTAMDNLTHVADVQVSPLFIDTNEHMNNSYYLQIADRYLPKDYEFTDGEIAVAFKKSALEGETLSVYRAVENDICQIVLKEADEVYTIIEFRKNKA